MLIYPCKSIFVLMILCFLHSNALGLVTNFHGDNKGNVFNITCNNDNCVVAAKNQRGKQYTKNISLPINKTLFIWEGNNLLQILAHFGSNDDISIFFNFISMQLSKKGFENVIAIDKKHNVVVTDHFNEILVEPIFKSGSVNHIKRKFDGPVPVSVDADQTYFLDNGNLFLVYAEKAPNKDGFILKKEIIDIHCKNEKTLCSKS